MWTEQIGCAAEEPAAAGDVASDLQDQGLQAYIDIDRDAAGRYGVTPAAIDSALYDAFGQRLISTIYTQANQYRVVLEADPDSADQPAAAGGYLCPLRSNDTPGGARRHSHG